MLHLYFLVRLSKKGQIFLQAQGLGEGEFCFFGHGSPHFINIGAYCQSALKCSLVVQMMEKRKVFFSAAQWFATC